MLGPGSRRVCHARARDGHREPPSRRRARLPAHPVPLRQPLASVESGRGARCPDPSVRIDRREPNRCHGKVRPATYRQSPSCHDQSVYAVCSVPKCRRRVPVWAAPTSVAIRRDRRATSGQRARTSPVPSGHRPVSVCQAWHRRCVVAPSGPPVVPTKGSRHRYGHDSLGAVMRHRSG